MDDRLAGGFSLGDLQAIVSERSAAEIMLVGHEPDLSMLASDLIGDVSIDLKKGGLIRIDADLVEPGRGVLKWLLAPSVLVADD